MSAVIVLTSSSPPACSRTPTPALLSSPPRSLFGPCEETSPDRSKWFKRTSASASASTGRDGFTHSVASARALLSTKVGAENIPLASPRVSKFKIPAANGSRSPPKFSTSNAGVGAAAREPTVGTTGAEDSPHRFVQHSCRSIAAERKPDSISDATVSLESRTREPESVPVPKSPQLRPEASPLQLERALPRRLDWTPVKNRSSRSTEEIGDVEDVTTGSFDGALDSFTFAAPAGNIANVATGTIVDRELIQKQTKAIPVATDTPTIQTERECQGASNEGKPATVKKSCNGKKKSRSSAKKPLTITGLATSLYTEGVHGKTNSAPVLQQPNATQFDTDATGSAPSTTRKKNATTKAPKTAKAKAKGQRAGASRKTPANKMPLLSPTSAMKTFHEQETIFGSASQLARGDSPTLARRKPLEATKRSGCVFSSSPISPQRTQPISTESDTPRASKAGTIRFVKRRNLWAAADRDEDNALLQIDTFDMVDSPAVRAALAGKDVLVQAGGTSEPPSKLSATMSRGLYDIDQFNSPVPQRAANRLVMTQARAFHTSTSTEARRRSASPGSQPASPHHASKAPAERADPAPPMPFYAGMSEHDLRKQVAAFGFKPIKSREKMIELLERCWNEKHGVAPTEEATKDAVEAMSHADFLSKVHDITARPTPKTKKTRAKRKSEGDTEEAKQPKRRKKAEPKEKEKQEPKTPSVAKTTKPKKKTKTPKKKSALSEETVADTSDAGDDAAPPVEPDLPRVEPMVALNGNEPVNKSNTTATSKPKKPATPPPTKSSPLVISSSPVREVVVSAPSLPVETEAPATPASTPPLLPQIRAAIEKSSKHPGSAHRNHQRHPTWHEKILMYDPIVLEDLTLWLNTEGFKAIGEDREVSAVEVREWCEAHGICCLWKGGRRGSRNARGEE